MSIAVTTMAMRSEVLVSGSVPHPDELGHTLTGPPLVLLWAS
jgi:hypothetical protein